MRVSVSVMKGYDPQLAPNGSRKHFVELLAFLCTAVTVPVLWPSSASEVFFRLGSFDAGICPEPGSRVPSAGLTGHPAPWPWPVQMRNANAMFSFLWTKRGSGDARFQGDRGLEAVVVARSRPPRSSRSGCVLFPACADVAGGAGSCDVCLARHVCTHGWLYPDLSPEQADAVERIRASTAEEGDAETLDSLRGSLALDLSGYLDDSDEDEAEAAWLREVLFEEEAVAVEEDEWSAPSWDRGGSLDLGLGDSLEAEAEAEAEVRLLGAFCDPSRLAATPGRGAAVGETGRSAPASQPTQQLGSGARRRRQRDETARAGPRSSRRLRGLQP